MVEDIVRRWGYLTLGSRMRRIGDLLQGEVQQLLDERHIPVQTSHYTLLASLDANGPLLIGDLAETLGVSQPGITRSVAQLSKVGLVTVRQGKNDQRQRVVTLTARGQRLMDSGREDFWPKIENCLAAIMAGQSGPLLEQLDFLEDAIRAQSFSQRITKSNREGGSG